MSRIEKIVDYLYCQFKKLGTTAFSNNYEDLQNKPNYAITIENNVLNLLENGQIIASEDISIYLDDTNLSRIVSGVIDSNTGIATFTRDDSSSFDMDLSTLIDVQPDKTSDLLNDGQDGTSTYVEQTDLDGKVDKQFLGWIQVADTEFDDTNRKTVLSDVRTKITNNAGAVIDVAGMFGSTSIWNPTTNKFEPDNIGDTYDWRVQFIADPTLNNRNLTLELDIGGTKPIVWQRTIRLARGAGIDTRISELLDIYVLNTFVANGGELYITCDGDVDIYDIVFKIERKFRN